MVRILRDDWSTRLGENRSDQPLKHLTAMLMRPSFSRVLSVATRPHRFLSC